MQQIESILRVVTKKAMIAGKVQWRARRAHPIPIAAMVLVEAAKSRDRVRNGILLIASIPLHRQIGGVNGRVRRALRAPAVVKIPSRRTVERNPDVVGGHICSDCAADTVPG